MYVAVIILYLIAAILCGLIGRQTAFGFIGHFVLALIITPLGDFLVQLVARPSRALRRKINDTEIE
ncbi:hypothetical protein [Thalassospira sp.]|uniref:hypothetical protein n=1 Tax=Thalassospira sp. TaxID=1912094 RepID=UPI002734CC5F|nr:hypothetical protein [Thalassospira sp.]MDP2699975.1 hypothetical protein [Thalassospira sp.]